MFWKSLSECCRQVFKHVLLFTTRCSRCKWPICTENCSGWGKENGHTLDECDILSKIPFELQMDDQYSNVYNFIVPMRCLLLRKTDSLKWQALHSMESHCEIRKTIKSIWEFNEITVVGKLRDFFDPTEIHRVCGILEVKLPKMNLLVEI